MTAKTMMIPRQAALLTDIVHAYLLSGGPAWECAQEWEPSFSGEEVEALGFWLLALAGEQVE